MIIAGDESLACVEGGMVSVTDRIVDAEIDDEQQSLLTRLLGETRRHLRLTIAVSLLIICTCFAAATVLPMRRDYNHALALAAGFTTARAEVQASEVAAELTRLAAMGTAYMSVLDAAGAGHVIETTEGARLPNIALANAEGRFIRAMKGEAGAAAPLSADLLQKLRSGPVIGHYSDSAIGSSPLTLFFLADGDPTRILVMPIDPISLLPRRVLGESALFTPGGITLALGDGWDVPAASTLFAGAADGVITRQFEQNGIRRIVALAPVTGWPLTAAASVEAATALGTWYGSIPLYLFVILGPAIVGAALAILLVSEFERADRARSDLVTLKRLQQSRSWKAWSEPLPPLPRSHDNSARSIGLTRFE
jgi:hypothetical protein